MAAHIRNFWSKPLLGCNSSQTIDSIKKLRSKTTAYCAGLCLLANIYSSRHINSDKNTAPNFQKGAVAPS
jgi:hypothetical protein